MRWREYHEAMEPSIESFMQTRHGLDWANMPDPFRHYEGVPVDGIWIYCETDCNGAKRFVVEMPLSYQPSGKMNAAVIHVWEEMGRESKNIGEQVRPPRTALLAFGVSTFQVDDFRATAQEDVAYGTRSKAGFFAFCSGN